MYHNSRRHLLVEGPLFGAVESVRAVWGWREFHGGWVWNRAVWRGVAAVWGSDRLADDLRRLLPRWRGVLKRTEPMMKAEPIAECAVESATPSVATMGVDFFTIVRSATGKPLCGGWRDQRQVLAALRPMGVRREGWQVIGWVHDGRELRIGFEVDAGEFWWAHHPPRGELT